MTKDEFLEKLESLFENVRTPLFKDFTAYTQSNNKDSTSDSSAETYKVAGKISYDNVEVHASAQEQNKYESISSKEAVQILARFFDIIKFMNELKSLLMKVSINNVFICLDDMSEIDKESMEVFTDFIVGPLNNLSDEFYKFKISLYPGRDYLPSIDRQKVKTHNLDYYDLYSQGTVDKVEESAINYTEKLLNKRMDYYFPLKYIEDFFDVNSSFSMDDYYKLIFQISSNVPRIIGKVLEIALHKTNGLQNKINKRILQESARQHYKNDVEYVLSKSEYIEYKSYNESFEQFHLFDLLKKIIAKAIENKSRIGSSTASIFQSYTTNTAPSNYLYVPENLEDVLKTLEFNFFITKYNQQKDKDKDSVSIFTLNYGLCVDNNIVVDVKSDRKFRIERVFDYSKLVVDWMNNSKELICLGCGKKYDISLKDVFVTHNMPCTTCHGKVELQPVIDENYKSTINGNLKIPQNEYEVLNALSIKNTPMTASALGEELDCPYQSINHRIGKNSKINHYDMINRNMNGKQALFTISDNGILFINGKGVVA
jgi:hypothetical protein